MLAIIAYAVAAVTKPTPGRHSIEAQRSNKWAHRPGKSKHKGVGRAKR
jgi:hypothetical protein